jgi:glycosyltransferase involved in cell wall biosynthesis
MHGRGTTTTYSRKAVPLLRVAVVHGLPRGGAARRLSGTLSELACDADLVLRQFAPSGQLDLLSGTSGDATVEVGYITDDQPQAPERSRVLRPPIRYVDDHRNRAAWGRLWSAVNDWIPDVVFANPCSRPGGAPPGIGSSRSPVLYYCDEPRRVDYERPSERSTNPTTRMIYAGMRNSQRKTDRASVANASAIATNSDYTRRQIEAVYSRTSHVVTPGIDSVFHPLPVAAPTHVLSVGALIPTKGHDLAIRAVAAAGLQLPMTVVAPREAPQELGRLQRVADEAGVQLTVRVGVSDVELAALYRSALATVYLAREEPLGLVSLESQACGTPVVVADEGGLADTVDQSVTGYRVARRVETAAGALRAIVARRPEMAAAAARRTVPRNRTSAAAIRGLLDGLVPMVLR